MKCRNCDCELNGERFCPQCGCESTASDIYSRKEDGFENGNFYPEGQGLQVAPLSMKWYKAIKVFIIIGAVLNVLSAISAFTGASYEGFAEEVYDLLPSMRVIDLISGAYCIGMAIFNVYVWNALRNYKTNAPKYLNLIYILNLTVTSIINIACIFVLRGADTDIIYGDSYIQDGYMYQEYLDLSGVNSGLIATIIENVIVCVVMIAINTVYFRKRQHMFVN